MPQATLAEDVELVQPQVLGLQHAELRGGEALRRQVQRGVVGEGLLADQHAADVDAQVVRMLMEVLRVTQDGAGDAFVVDLHAAAVRGLRVVAAPDPARVTRIPFGERVDVRGRKAEDLAQFAHHGAALVGAVRGEQRDPALCTVGVEEVLRHLVTVLPTEVQVEVGRAAPAGVDEALEVEVELDGVHVGDAQAIGHQAVGATAAPHVEEALALREADQVPVDEEVAHEVLLSDHGELAIHTVHHLLRRCGIAAKQPRLGLRAQQFEVR